MSDQVTDNPPDIALNCPSRATISPPPITRLTNTAAVVTHTEVHYQYSGRGIGTRLAAGAFELIRASGRKAVLKCSFTARFYAMHREYDDIVDG